MKRRNAMDTVRAKAYEEGYHQAAIEAAKREKARELTPQQAAYVEFCKAVSQAISGMTQALVDFPIR